MKQKWDNLESVNVKLCNQKLLDMYKDAWHDEVAQKVKLSNYLKITEGWGVASQLKAYLSKQKRSLITQIKLGCLPLQIELGKYDGTARQDRICKMCKDEPETKFHFLFHCKDLDQIHTELLDKLPELSNLSNDCEKFKYLCNSPYTFANYIERLWNVRSERLSAK